MLAIVVEFKRRARSKWEQGIGVSVLDEPGQLDAIIDGKGKLVPSPIYDFQHRAYKGCMIAPN